MTTTTTEHECCAATYAMGYGIHPYSIVQRTRAGVKFYEAEWMPTRCRRRFATKREATAFVKHHEHRCYSRAAVR